MAYVSRFLCFFCLLGLGTANVSSGGTIINSVSWANQTTQLLSKANGGTIVQNGTTITVGWETGPGQVNSIPTGTIGATRNWSQIFGTNVFGADSPTGSLRIGFDTDNVAGGPYSATNPQKIKFSSPIIDPYLYVMYVQKGATYDFRGYTDVSVADIYPTAVFSGGLLTGTANDTPQAALILSFKGSYSEIAFNVDASGMTTQQAFSEISIAAPVSAFSSAAVPEPGSLAMCGIGALSLAYKTRRRRRAGEADGQPAK